MIAMVGWLWLTFMGSATLIDGLVSIVVGLQSGMLITQG
jgi:hypothetical protein